MQLGGADLGVCFECRWFVYFLQRAGPRMLEQDGKPVPGIGFVKIDADGKEVPGVRGYKFDTMNN